MQVNDNNNSKKPNKLYGSQLQAVRWHIVTQSVCYRQGRYSCYILYNVQS